MRYPIFSISEILFHDFQKKIPIPRSIMGITKEIPGRGVPNATPVFFICVILRVFQRTEKSGFEILTQYFVRISVVIINERKVIFFISSIVLENLFNQIKLIELICNRSRSTMLNYKNSRPSYWLI